MKNKKRRKNEKQFGNWAPADSGGRIYWIEITGRFGWKARYVKEVDMNEDTLVFR